MLHALSYSYRHRREKKGDMRRLWITRINAACRHYGMTYSQFISGLTKAQVDLNRKALADIAVTEPDTFSRLVDISKATLAAS